MMLVSVVIPAYNRADLISRAMRSVFSQTYTNWELIVVDDASTDATVDEVSRVAAESLPFENGAAFRLLRHAANAGVGTARNTGIHAARGELIAMLDSDDEFRPAHLAARVELFGGPVDLIAGGVELMGNQFEQVVDYFDNTRLIDLTECVVGGSLFGRAEVFRSLAGFNSDPYGEDTDFWIRAERAGYRTRLIREPKTYLVHETPGSLRTIRSERWRRDGK